MTKVTYNGKDITPKRGLGDAIASVATPIARILKLKCIDPETKQLRPDSDCARRKNKLNKIKL
jgi:hypothetical protein